MMLKSSGRLRTTFKSRHFVLFEEGILRYYTNKKAREPLGAINLCLVKWIQVEKATYQKKLFEFSLQEAHRQWQLKLGSLEDMNNWVQVLKKIRLRVIDEYTTKFLSEKCQSRMSFSRKSPILVDSAQTSPRSLTQDNNSDSFEELFAAQKKAPLPIYHGFFWKVGRSVRSWKKRFCVLYNNRIINYFENRVDPQKPMRKPKGKIDLWGVVAIRQMTKEEAEMVKLPKECREGLILQTSDRQWLLGMKTDEDLNNWMTKILENCIFDVNARRKGTDSITSVNSRRWSIAARLGDVVSKSMGYSKISQEIPRTMNFKGERSLSSPVKTGNSSERPLAMSDNPIKDLMHNEPLPSPLIDFNTCELQGERCLSTTL